MILVIRGKGLFLFFIRWMFLGVMVLEGSVLMKKIYIFVRVIFFFSVINILGFLIFLEIEFIFVGELSCFINVKEF